MIYRIQYQASNGDWLYTSVIYDKEVEVRGALENLAKTGISRPIRAIEDMHNRVIEEYAPCLSK